MNSNCPICSELNQQVHFNHNEVYGQLILSNENIIWHNDFFSIIASIGPLNDSHILIVPNIHCNSMSSLEDKYLIELKKVMILIRKKNLSNGFKTEFFEHGTGNTHDTSSASIYHAHLHALATNKSIMETLEDEIKFEKIKFEELNKNHTNKEKGYLLINDLYNNTYINNNNIFSSQFLRKKYAEIFGKENWDWRKENDIELVKTIISKYKNLFF